MNQELEQLESEINKILENNKDKEGIVKGQIGSSLVISELPTADELRNIEEKTKEGYNSLIINLSNEIGKNDIWYYGFTSDKKWKRVNENLIIE